MKKYFFCLILIFIAAYPLIAVEVKCFYPSKDWQISVDINGLEPDYSSIENVTLFSGNANGIQVTLLADDANGRNAVQDRERYGLKRANSTGDKESIKLFDVNDFKCIKYKWKKNISNSSFNNTWGYFGFYVKDDIVFNFILTADITEHNEDELISIIKSFKIETTKEIKELNDILSIMEAKFNASEDKENELASRVKKGQEYLQRYPDCQEVLYRLGDYYTRRNQSELGRSYYLKALESAKTKIPLSSQIIWNIQEGLGENCALSNKLVEAMPYFKNAYELAQKRNALHALSMSAYNLACCYAETNDVDNSLKYIAESLKANPNNLNDIINDSSFSKLNQDRRFKKIIAEYKKK
ncbi:MAG: hypothetical protein ABFD79_16955 [Phycisphaerales bacterium]